MSEILTLVTNSMKNDLRSGNQYVVGLALTAAGNIGSPEMMRNLAPEIDRRMRDRNPYIRKKAALCALRVVHKVPELAEDFYERVGTLLNDRNHGVFINGVALVSRVVTDPELEDLASNFKTISVAKKMVKRLESLVRSGYQPEYDVAGITDPFCQVAILRLLRYLGQNDSELSEVMSDILAQVATNTDGNKNTANAILYECVSTWCFSSTRIAHSHRKKSNTNSIVTKTRTLTNALEHRYDHEHRIRKRTARLGSESSRTIPS